MLYKYRYIIIIIAFLSLTLISCFKYGGCGEFSNANCRIILPTENQEFLVGDTIYIYIDADAGADGYMEFVKLYLDNNFVDFVEADSFAQYSYLITDSLSLGSHIIKTEGEDNCGFEATDSKSIIIVDE